MAKTTTYCSSRLNGEGGMAIILVTFLMMVTLILGAALIFQTTQGIQLANRSFDDKRAFYLAESGKEYIYEQISRDWNFTKEGDPGEIPPDPGAMKGGTCEATATTEFEDLTEPQTKIVRVVSVGRTGGVPKEITAYVKATRTNINVWNNAIFGGSGQTGGVVTGNAAVHGSVHLLGDGVGEGNASILALDMNGTALIHNNYEGMPDELMAKVPPLPTVEYHGEKVETLNAKLRVKNGAVGISGKSEIGEPNVPENGFKETMDGIYIETNLKDLRWTGNKVDENGVPDPGHVSSDNGTGSLYDLEEDAVTFPILFGQPYTDTKGTETPADDEVYLNYHDYFLANSLYLPPLRLDGTNSAFVDLQEWAEGPVAAGLIQMDVTGTKITITDLSDVSVPPEERNSFSYDYAAVPGQQGLLEINGMIRIDGYLQIGADVGQPNFEIYYDGSGTIYVAPGAGPGDINFYTNFLPLGTFPTDDVVGFMAANCISIAGSGDSHLMLAGAFYAGVKIESSKQNRIAGTFVCNYFDMGSSVPRIYQVPELVNHLPKGLIGSDPIWQPSLEEKSWQVRSGLTPVPES